MIKIIIQLKVFHAENKKVIWKQEASLENRLSRAKQAWPSHQILPAEWNDRSVTPPAGQIWASDGVNVWLIRSDGTPIEAGATAVKWWTTAYIPAPPNGRQQHV